MLQPRTIRIFISSTFKDMHSERDYLVKFVFPEMRPRAFFYFRNAAFIKDVAVSKQTEVTVENPGAANKLHHLKEDIKDTFKVFKLPGHITESYNCRYKGIKTNLTLLNFCPNNGAHYSI